MKILSYNINGINAFCKAGKNCEQIYENYSMQNDSKMCNLMNDFTDYDTYCFQEVKGNSDKVRKLLAQKADYMFSLVENPIKKGYAGVMNFNKPNYEGNISEHNFAFNGDSTYTEGRVLTTEYNDFYLINVYVPNSGNKEELRKDWDRQFREYIKTLNKPVIIVGDMNVCATKYDYWGNYEKAINTSPGLMDFEIEGFKRLCEECNLIDVFRKRNKETRKYSWYSTRNKLAIEKNQGWRLDYVLVSSELEDKIINIDICQGYQAPDHSPIIVEIKD